MYKELHAYCELLKFAVENLPDHLGLNSECFGHLNIATYQDPYKRQQTSGCLGCIR